MSRYRFELAGPEADADLRRILAETPMGGHVAVTFRREPSYFDAAAVDGHCRQIVAARDLESGRLVGFGSRALRRLYVNGRPCEVGYLSSLRLLAAHRNRGLVARGYALFKRLHRDGRAPLYLTTIAEGNEPALRLLTSGRSGLPAYHDAGRYHTLALPLRCGRRRTPALGLEVRPAAAADLPTVLRFLTEVGPRRQFFPCYEAGDFFGEQGAFKGLRPADLLLAFRGGRLVGTLGGWDQHAFRQVIVQAYGKGLRWARPLYNLWARLRGGPRLPAPGEPFRYLTAALPVVDGEPEVLRALLETLGEGAADGPCDCLLLGLHETDPLLKAVTEYRAARYTTRLYLVCWEDGEALRTELEKLVPYLELGSL